MAFSTSAFLVTAVLVQADTAAMQHMHPPAAATTHEMFEHVLPGGWRLAGMAQLVPVYTLGRTPPGDTPLDTGGVYLTQVAAMANLESPGRRVVLRITPNLEGLTQPDGEPTLGAWGEGFIDARHPHTLLHEAMLSVNLWRDGPFSASLSAGKGFAPYGTEDPMSRPSAKYPSNHHLSQLLERATLNATLLWGRWGFEAGLFGGAEPDGPYDFTNLRSFGDSWSGRLSRRFGPETMSGWPWEVSASYGRVEETHEDPSGVEDVQVTELYNVALRYEGGLGPGRAFALAEASTSDPREGEGTWSILGELRATFGRHTPYVRLERATRPEYPRDATTGEGFFRYDHDADEIGATAWSIATLGYGFVLTGGAASVRPFAELQAVSIAGERGGVSADGIFGANRAYALTVGARIFLGGAPMRMGTYGVLDPMTRMGREPMAGMGHAMGTSR